MSLDELFAEAERQLSICNACRYCEGYCAVWPALELRGELAIADTVHLANLCHDCRDCFTACMYTAPHEFDLNPPRIFTEIRAATYRTYVWPRAWPRVVPRPIRGAAGIAMSAVIIGLILAGLSFIANGGRIFRAGVSGSPYGLLPYPLMIMVATLPALWGIVIGVCGALRYWRGTHGTAGGLGSARAWRRALASAARLRNMRGGGEQECAYPGADPTPARRRFHAFASYGLLLCLAATIAAGIEQDFLGIQPPYPLLSAPVMLGIIGGAGMVIGCAGLLALKQRSARELTTDAAHRAGNRLLGALLILALTGLLTLAVRNTALFGPVLLIHLASITTCFAIAPYTNFMHWVYRLLALYQDEWEHAAARTGSYRR
jgi:citrate/tricarballylate utilization protein